MEEILEEIHFEFVDSDDFIHFIKLLIELQQTKDICYLFNMKIRLTESELISLIKKIIKEEKISVEDIKYTHPRTGKECLIKVAKHKHSRNEHSEYSAVVVCDVYGDGEYMVIAELPVFGGSFDEVSDFLCDNLDRTFEILDKMLDYDKSGEEISENYSKFSKWDIIEKPIICSNIEDEDMSSSDEL